MVRRSRGNRGTKAGRKVMDLHNHSIEHDGVSVLLPRIVMKRRS